MASEQVSSIVRALDILECFTDQSVEWTLKNLVEHLHMPTTTVFRQVSTLTKYQYLVQDPVRKSYRVGPRLLMFSSSILGQSDLRTTARPELERLSATVQETINLSVLIGNDIFYLDKVETFRSIVCNTKLGTRAYAHATSGGKALIAWQTAEYLEQYYRELPHMEKLTDRTITTAERLKVELDSVRMVGYALDDGEIEPGLVCIGAPLYDMNGKVIAAVSISGPNYRMRKDMAFMRQNVVDTALRISTLLGYRRGM